MSGTSLDGISGAVVRFPEQPTTSGVMRCELLVHQVRPYTPSERRRLERAIQDGASTAEWCQLGFDVGGWLADAAEQLLEASGVARDDVRAVASHGQTAWHVPGHSTWQIGEAAVIAERTGLDVVSDFRVRDMAAGGQGAPLVPMADAVLFGSTSEWRALQNLGGIGNVSIVPPRGERSGGRGRPAGDAAAEVAPVRAFDTGPGLMVVDGVVRTLRPQSRYDVDGELARRGTPIASVVDALLRDPYFAAAPPKSTGREHFGATYVASFLGRCRDAMPQASDADVVATAVSLTARSVADAYRRFVTEPVTEVLLSGGGARNPVLVEALVRELAPRTVRLFADEYFDGEAKEAVAFALLAALHLAGQPGNIPSATGARGPRVLGKMTPGGGRREAGGGNNKAGGR
jgi:anhydro-N-acetylmuramic acid kinase